MPAEPGQKLTRDDIAVAGASTTESPAAATMRAANEQGTRVWNHWDDQVAADLQKQAAQEAADTIGVQLADAREEHEAADEASAREALTSGRTEATKEEARRSRS